MKEPSETLIHAGGMKLFCIAMLRKLPAGKIREFWQAHPLRIGDCVFAEADLYRHLWRDDPFVPKDYAVAVYEDLEPFLNGLGFILEDFREALIGAWPGAFLAGKDALDWFQPLFLRLCEAEDPMTVGIEAIAPLCEAVLPGSASWKLGKRESGNFREIVMAFATDRDFRAPVVTDVNTYGRWFLTRLPEVFGLPPFDAIPDYCDCRQAPDIVREAACGMDGDIFRIEGEPFGRRIDFLDFCRRAGFDLGGRPVPGGPVILMERDYQCPARKRIVLHRGSAYGAPFYALGWRYKRSYSKPENPLEYLARHVAQAGSTEADGVEAAHRELLALAESKSVWVYDSRNEALQLDGRRLFKGTQARLLRRMIQIHLEEGTVHFPYVRLKYDAEITDSPKRSNLELHLKRVSERLASTCPSLKLEFRERGRCSLVIKQNLGLSVH